MQEWQDQALVLASRPHGEYAAIVELFTPAQGRHNGVVRGGTGRRLAPVLQPGNLVQALWRARLSEQIGTLTVEPIRSRAHAMAGRLPLAGLSSVTALLHVTLPERAPHPGLWAPTLALLDRLEEGNWPSLYLRWEMLLLQELGFGLDLTACAVTGSREDLAYVSPKTGRAVSRAGAGDWAERLFPLPAGLGGGAVLAGEALLQGLRITGHFLARECLELAGRKALPEARGRLIDLLTASVRRQTPRG